MDVNNQLVKRDVTFEDASVLLDEASQVFDLGATIVASGEFGLLVMNQTSSSGSAVFNTIGG